MNLLLSLLSLACSTSAVSGTHIVGYIDFPTCYGFNDRDAACLTALGVPGYAEHPYNVLNFAFYVSDQNWLADALGVWANPSNFFSLAFRQQIVGTNSAVVSDDDFRRAVKAMYASQGIKILVSVFGGTDHPMASGLDPVSLAETITELVTLYDFDGADIDWEETAFLEAGASPTGEDWLVTLTQELRAMLPRPYIITHAPQAPYFGTYPNYPRGGYLNIHERAGDLIDWYNVQFYNQGSTTYGTYQSLFQQSGGWAAGTSVGEIVSGNNFFGISVPESKLVIGKFVRPGLDGSAGHVVPETLRDWFQEYGWTNGFMLWQTPSDASTNNYLYSRTVATAFGPPTTAAPTAATPAPVTAAPSAPTTPSPTSSVDNIRIQNRSPTLWWYGMNILGAREAVTGVELVFNGVTTACYRLDDLCDCAWQCTPPQQLAYPMTLRLSSSSGATIVGQNVITSNGATAIYDFGSNF